MSTAAVVGVYDNALITPSIILAGTRYIVGPRADRVGPGVAFRPGVVSNHITSPSRVTGTMSLVCNASFDSSVDTPRPRS